MKDKDIGVSEAPNKGKERDEVQSWLRTIESTVKYRDEIGNKAGWTRFIDEYKNKWDWLQSTVSIPLIPINLIYSYVKTEIARLYFKDPWITVNPKRQEDIGAAQIGEQVINYIWSDLNIKNQIKQALLESILVGHSWIKVGYVAEFGTVESKPKEEVKRGPGRPSSKKKEVETSEYIKSESAFAYYVPYKDVVFDPAATYPCTHNARWMAQKIVKPYRAVVESGIYQNTDKLKPGYYSEEIQSIYESSSDSGYEGGKNVKSVILWEIYDLDNKVITTLSPGCDAKLREVPYPDYLVNSFPFVQIAFNPVPGDVYPLSDIAPFEGQVIEMIKMISIELNHLKRWNRQMITDPDLFSKEEKAKFKDAIDGAIIEAQSQGAASKLFIPPYAPVQSDIYGVFQQIFQLWQMISSQTGPDQGGQARTQTRTLGELRLVMQGSKARSEERLDALEDCVAEIARKIMNIIQKKYDLPQIARIVGPRSIQEKILKYLPQRPSVQDASSSGQPNPVALQAYTSDFAFSWNRTDITGDMDVDVLAGSTVPMDRESQIQIMENMVPLLSLAGVTPGSPPAKAFAEEILRLIGIVSLQPIMDMIQAMPPTPDPKMTEIQARSQAKQTEAAIKVRGELADEKMETNQLLIKQQMDREKNMVELEKQRMQNRNDTIKSVLEQFRKYKENTVSEDSFGGMS